MATRPMVLALALLIAAVLVRSASTNRHVRGRLLVSAFTFGFATLFTLALRYLASLPAAKRAPLEEAVTAQLGHIASIRAAFE